MGFPALVARFIPWGAAAEAGVRLAKIGLDYKLERDRLKDSRRSRDLGVLEARIDAMEERFENQLLVMQELASGLEQEIGRMRKAVVAASVGSALAGGLALVALLVALL